MTVYEQYTELQKQYPQQVIAIRIGDFYEVLGEDAQILVDILNLTMTGKEVKKDGNRVAMVGFPYHMAKEYQDKLLAETGLLMHLIEIDHKR